MYDFTGLTAQQKAILSRGGIKRCNDATALDDLLARGLIESMKHRHGYAVPRSVREAWQRHKDSLQPLSGAEGQLSTAPHAARDRAIVAMYLDGASYKAIGHAFDLSFSRVSQVVLREAMRWGITGERMPELREKLRRVMPPTA